MSNVIRFPARMRRPLARCVDAPTRRATPEEEAAWVRRYKDPLVAVELTENAERIAIRLPFASTLIKAADARSIAWTLLHLANELDARAE